MGEFESIDYTSAKKSQAYVPNPKVVGFISSCMFFYGPAGGVVSLPFPHFISRVNKLQPAAKCWKMIRGKLNFKSWFWSLLHSLSAV